MGYINDFRGKLKALIEEGKAEEAVKFAADTVLESYRNGAELAAIFHIRGSVHATTQET